MNSDAKKDSQIPVIPQILDITTAHIIIAIAPLRIDAIKANAALSVAE